MVRSWCGLFVLRTGHGVSVAWCIFHLHRSSLALSSPYTLVCKSETISRYSKLVYIIMFRICRYALAHSFAYKHRFYWSRSPLRQWSLHPLRFASPPLSGEGNPLQPMFLNKILHQFISTNFEHLLNKLRYCFYITKFKFQGECGN